MKRALWLVYDDRQSTFKEQHRQISYYQISYHPPQKFTSACYRITWSTSWISSWTYEHFLKKEMRCTISEKKISIWNKKYKDCLLWFGNNILSRPKNNGNICQVSLRIQKILTSSNQILNLESLKTVHAVCAGCILQDIGFIEL